MKKYLSLLVIMLALVMQSFTILPGLTPVYLRPEIGPVFGGNHKPTKSDPNTEPPVSVYLNEAADSLLLYSPSEESVTYYIYDEDELEVSNGNVIFSEQGEASIYLGSLNEGTYSISLVVDTLVYVGEFDKN